MKVQSTLLFGALATLTVPQVCSFESVAPMFQTLMILTVRQVFAFGGVPQEKEPKFVCAAEASLTGSCDCV